MGDKRQNGEYAGFISYRHVSPDQEIAEALHHMLEHNKVRLSRKYRKAIRPVFMDRKELPLLADLDEGITGALERSDCLFVICSPNLPKSKYCLREIEYFKKLHNGSTNRIFTLLVDGTPEESFPEILRTKTRLVTNPDGTVCAEQVEAEPLFADVRGKDLEESLRKLRRTEYLRLAAGYYGCSYDALYKRRTRWIATVIARVLAVAMVLSAGFGWYAYNRNEQYSTAKANTYASYAEKQTRERNELLALALCDYAQPATSERMDLALRNPAVQMDYRRRSDPISEVFGIPYDDIGSTIFYLNEAQNQVLIFNGSIYKIIDVETGAVTLETPAERLFVDRRKLDYYLLLESHPDENKILRDYVVLYDLNTNEKIREFSFREASRDRVNYRLTTAAETDQLLVVRDGAEYVAYLTRDGYQLSEAEFVERAQQILKEAEEQQPVPEKLPLQVQKRRTLLSEKSVIVDEAGNVVLELGEKVGLVTFSSDWTHLACEAEGEIRIYDVMTGQIINRWTIERNGLGAMHMLRDSTYLLHSYWQGNMATTVATDWLTGIDLAVLPGKPMISDMEQAFFTVQAGTMRRYEYTAMDLSTTAKVAAQTETRALAWNNDTVYLYDTVEKRLLLELESRQAENTRWDPELTCILIPAKEGVSCFDRNGQLQWTDARAVGEIAVSEDGKLCAWEDAEANVHIVDSKTGLEKRVVTAGEQLQSGMLMGLAVSPGGLCTVGTDSVLWQPEQGEAVSLGNYSDAAVYTDGLLIVSDQNARVLDFQIFDTVSGNTVYEPEENTGSWAYNSGSGYLVRQAQTSGNYNTNRVEVLLYKKGQMQKVGEILLDKNDSADLTLDSTGKWLSINTGERTMVYRLEDMHLYLDAICKVRYEARAFWANVIHGEYQYCAKLCSREELLSYAQDVLTSSLGKRSLTEHEMSLYSFSD